MKNNLIFNEFKELLKNLDLEKTKNITIEKLILKAKENAAATTISSNYRNKMAIDKEFKNLGDYICNDLGKKDVYREIIARDLESKKSPNHIKNLYLYYCKFGSKILGFDKNSFLIKKNNKFYIC